MLLVPLCLAHRVGGPLNSGDGEVVTVVFIQDDLREGLLLSRMIWSFHLS